MPSPSSPLLHGVDLSHHNGEHAAPLDVDFAIVRVSYGTPDGRTLPDLAAEGHLERLTSGGRKPVLAAYHYLATGPYGAPGEDQAAVYLARLGELEARFGLLGRALDSEPLRNKDAAGKAIPWDPIEVVRDRVLGFAMGVSAARPCLAYGSREWWARLELKYWFAMHCPFWAASSPPAPLPWEDIAIQQLPQPVGGVDRNTFEGTREELRALLGLPA